MHMNSRIQVFLLVFLYASVAGWSGNARAADLDIAETPLFAAISIDPNIMFTLDDSGSMQWEGMPVNWAHIMPQVPNPYGGVTYGRNIPRFRDNYNWNLQLRNPQLNGVFYNPELNYRPWLRADGSDFPDADPDAAFYNPDLPGNGTFDLDSLATWTNWTGGGPNDTGSNNQFWPITFYIYDGTGNTASPDNYTKYQIRENSAFTATPANGPMVALPQFTWGAVTRTIEEEKQNFANWFVYSRSRVLAARNGIGRAFGELPSNARVGFAAINQGFTNVDGVTTRAIIDGVRPFSGTDREDFYDRLYGRVINNFGTPLRGSAEAVGEYFSRTDARGPWSSTPGSTGGDDLACRQSYHILMTDGFWNGFNPGVGNSDNSNGPSHTSPEGDTYQYTPTDPFRDTRDNTLGDVAMHYWKRDLRTDLENRVPTNDVDPAFWQHLTTFGIGLGVTGNLDQVVVEQAVVDGTPINWGNPYGPDADKIDDLLHFGINGRGGFFSATDPDAFAAQLGQILRDIVARSGATTGLSASSTRLNAGSIVYTAGFDSEDWSGDLLAIDVETGTELESAANRLTLLGHTGRNIVTWDPVDEKGVVFAPSANLTPRLADGVLVTDPMVPMLVDYISGDLTAGAGLFRDRTSMLGDIVGSQPAFSGPRNEGWGAIDADYFTYIDGPKRDPRDPCTGGPPCPGNRRNTVFVGGNDGMLHAFDAQTLEEHFAYVPAAVHDKLWQLADPGYAHQYYVDGQVAIADAEIGGSWGTVLVGTLGAGGRGVYALDVTKPQSFDPAVDVLWEFTAEDDEDIGFTFGQPAIARMDDGTWVAIFGNGYNSKDRQAYLYVVDLIDGPDGGVIKIPVGPDGANGLSGVAAVSSEDDPLHVRYVYAGDIKGNMWRFDYDSGSGWSAGLGADPLFTDPDGRPIIAAPDVALHPIEGNMVFYGTGKLIENGDRLNTTSLDRFYAVRDLDAPITAIGLLDEVAVTAGPSGKREFAPSGTAAKGWYADLTVGAPSGERVLFSPQVFAGRVLFGSYEPVNDPCIPGGTQRAYVLNALSGGGNLPGDPACPNCGGVVIGTGAALAPVIGIRDPDVTPGTPGSNPGVYTPPPPCVGPTCPPDPGPSEPPVPPGTAGGGRDNWCRSYGLLESAGSFVPLGTICEGRQAWRQIR